MSDHRGPIGSSEDETPTAVGTSVLARLGLFAGVGLLLVGLVVLALYLTAEH